MTMRTKKSPNDVYRHLGSTARKKTPTAHKRRQRQLPQPPPPPPPPLPPPDYLNDDNDNVHHDHHDHDHHYCHYRHHCNTSTRDDDKTTNTTTASLTHQHTSIGMFYLIFYLIFVLLMFYLQLDYVYGTETTRTPPPSPPPLYWRVYDHCDGQQMVDGGWWAQWTMAQVHLRLEPKVCFFGLLLNIFY